MPRKEEIHALPISDHRHQHNVDDDADHYTGCFLFIHPFLNHGAVLSSFSHAQFFPLSGGLQYETSVLLHG